MIFLAMLLLSAISLASAAGYFSVIGLSETYAASAISIIIMGTCLEASKLVLASFIHKFWSIINIPLKGICCMMLAVLMFITSYGVFSHLTSAYQQDSVPLTEISTRLTNDKSELDRLVARKSQMDAQIAKLPDNYVKARTQLIKSFGEEYTTVPNRINELNKEITDLNSKQLATETKIGPIIYLAKVLGWEADKTIFWFTSLITIVFDPLAVTLVFAYNIALAQRKREKKEQEAYIKSLKEVSTEDDDNEDGDIEKHLVAGNPEPNAHLYQMPVYEEVVEDTVNESKLEPIEELVEDDEIKVWTEADELAYQAETKRAIIALEKARQESRATEEASSPPKEDVMAKMYETLRAQKKPVD